MSIRSFFSGQPSWGYWEDPWTSFPSPSRLFDQHFGLGLTDDDFLPPQLWRGMVVRPRTQRPTQHSGVSEVTNTDQEFKVMIDVQHFTPAEIKVKTLDNRIVITAKHEEREDEHGYICREFTRTYVLPKDVDPQTVTSSLNKEGVLTIKAPKKAIEGPKEQIIPITHEQVPAEAVDEEMKEK